MSENDRWSTDGYVELTSGNLQALRIVSETWPKESLALTCHPEAEKMILRLREQDEKLRELMPDGCRVVSVEAFERIMELDQFNTMM